MAPRYVALDSKRNVLKRFCWERVEGRRTLISQYVVIANSEAAMLGVDEVNFVVDRSNSHGNIVMFDPRNRTEDVTLDRSFYIRCPFRLVFNKSVEFGR